MIRCGIIRRSKNRENNFYSVMRGQKFHIYISRLTTFKLGPESIWDLRANDNTDIRKQANSNMPILRNNNIG